MNTVFKVMIFSIMLNLAIGLMTTAFPGIFGEGYEVNTGGLEYQVDYADDFRTELNASVNPSEQLEDTSNFLDRILDKLTIGIWGKVLNTLDRYVYGIVPILDAAFGGFLDYGSTDTDLRGFLFGSSAEHPIGILRTILSVGYIVGAIFLWTGRDLRD